MTMTTGTPPESSNSVLCRWAAEQLELPADVSAKESRSAFMQRLRDEDFMPPRSWQQASRALLGGVASENVAARAFNEEEGRLRSVVETFAVEFFSLDVPMREQRWRELRDQCAFSPPLTARLRSLERGLRVSGESPMANPSQQELAGYVRELFVLGPRARAARRQKLLHELTHESRQPLANAADVFRSEHPMIAALERDLVGQLESWNRRAWKRHENRKKPINPNLTALATPTPQGQPEDVMKRGTALLGFLIAIVILVAVAIKTNHVKQFPNLRGADSSVPQPPAIDFDKRLKNQGDAENVPFDVRQGKRPRFPGEGIKDAAVGVEETAKKIDELRKHLMGSESKVPLPDTRP
jgi:hypothetical protein